MRSAEVSRITLRCTLQSSSIRLSRVKKSRVRNSSRTRRTRSEENTTHFEKVAQTSESCNIQHDLQTSALLMMEVLRVQGALLSRPTRGAAAERRARRAGVSSSASRAAAQLRQTCQVTSLMRPAQRGRLATVFAARWVPTHASRLPASAPFDARPDICTTHKGGGTPEMAPPELSHTACHVSLQLRQ